MPRKPEPSFKLKKIIWDMAGTIGTDNWSALYREVNHTLEKLRDSGELFENVPEERKVHDIIELDIQRLSPEVVVAKLPRHVWRLRNDYKEIIRDLEDIQDDTQKQRPVGEEDQLLLITEAVTIQPSQKGFTDTESLIGAKYLDISIPSNDLWIESITIITSHPKAPYKFLIFDRKQPGDFYNEEDMFWEEEFYDRRTQYVQPQLKRYHDADECKHLHCGFEHEGHPRDFGMEEQELRDYFRQQVTYTVRLEYKLSFGSGSI